MKKLLLFVFVLVLAANSFGQSLIGLFGGAGLATSNNYDVGVAYGLKYHKAVGQQTWIGATLLSQGYSLYVDNEANSAKNHTGYAGSIERFKVGYIFVAPEFVHDLGHKGLIEWYLNIGVGFKMSGYDSLRKWDHSQDSLAATRFDSTLDMSKNINSMMLRVGTGFTEYLHMGRGNWWFTVTEDFGFVAGSLMKRSEASPGMTPYSPQKLSPGYVSVHIGIAHVKLRH